MSACPNVAVCIPTRNQSQYIWDALHSAFSQTQLPVDVVVSDDAGTDDTREVVERFRLTLAPELRFRLRYDRAPIGFGIGGNFDRAVRLAEGEFVVKLDSDDLLEPEFVEVLHEYLEANPKAGWAHCNIWNIRPDKTVMGLAHTRKRTGYYPAETALPAYLKHNDTCHCVMIRKSAYLAVGGYRSEMTTCEDWLLWLEMLLAGWGFIFDSRPLARMRKHPARFDLMTRRRQAFVESCRFMVPRVDGCLGQKALAGLSAEAARVQFHAAVARLCISSGCDEENPKVRRMLFDCAYEFHPSLRNHAWRLMGAPLPAETTRLWSRVGSWPRDCVRYLIQMMRRQRQTS